MRPNVGGNYEKENYEPLGYMDNYETNRVSIMLPSEPTTFRNTTYFHEEKPRRESREVKYKTRNSGISNIEERYNKYVLNKERVNKNRHSSSRMTGMTANKEVSMILGGLGGQESKISKISPHRVTLELEDSEKRGVNAFIDPGVSGDKSGTVTYERLRHFLMED